MNSYYTSTFVEFEYEPMSSVVKWYWEVTWLDHSSGSHIWTTDTFYTFEPDMHSAWASGNGGGSGWNNIGLWIEPDSINFIFNTNPPYGYQPTNYVFKLYVEDEDGFISSQVTGNTVIHWND